MAIMHGVDILDTNIWWFAEGSAAPAIELIYIFAQKLGVESEVVFDSVASFEHSFLVVGLSGFDGFLFFLL